MRSVPKRGRQRKHAPKPAVGSTPDGLIRLNRFIAQSGVCSRRKADELIAAGRVKVNGSTIEQQGTKVSPDDAVEVNGRLLTPLSKTYVLLNKPQDTITTTSDERDRRTVLDLIKLPAEKKDGLYPVGRLDRNTVGALILTNDGDLAHRLMHPRYQINKIYLATTERPVKPHELQRLQNGVELDDGPAKPDHVTYSEEGGHSRVALQLHEGRNRQVRRMFEAIGHEVKSLDRVSYAGLTCKELRRGKWRTLSRKEINRLRRSVGLKSVG